MVVLAIIIMFAIFIIAEWFYLQYQGGKQIDEEKIPQILDTHIERYYHPGHTWVELNPEDRTVHIGLDSFTRKIIGTVDRIDLPKEGNIIQQGSPLWTLIRGSRQLTQVTPVTGKVIQVNSPGLEQWLVKLIPLDLHKNLNNLLHGDLAEKWLDWSKSQFVMKFVPNQVPVYQDGGELVDDLCKNMTEEQWKKVQKEFFCPPLQRNQLERK